MKDSVTYAKYQKSEICMDGICKKAGLSNQTVQQLSGDKPSIPSLMKYRQSLENAGNFFRYFIISTHEEDKRTV